MLRPSRALASDMLVVARATSTVCACPACSLRLVAAMRSADQCAGGAAPAPAPA
eukprot:CAMPEP_0204334500 /NCGR_PEP_ID=MMETSP0469-20131031/18070_1 /ASSEMBLY_ACC=CAM_ASM_000384 /TAXON_ID=2969 /ORGANISM="Oxyrrhis marina" /LENGTH=53 /DNA_ID=CAMNT_0051318025 /DNA_START=48 /DNA_END=205 /DNA_ORIENTATION=+